MLIKNILKSFVISAIISANAIATPCDDAIEKANKLIQEQRAIINIDEQLIKSQQNLNNALTDRVNIQQAELESPYRNTLLMISLGFVAGILISK